MARDYWSRILNQRIGRRRALAAAGATTAAAALLAACGGGDDGDGGGESSSGLVTKPVDTTKEAKRGGVLKWFHGGEPANLDVQVDQAPKNILKNMAYGHFVNEEAGKLGPPSYANVLPEMMESWEWSGDGLQLTFKMRQGVKWHNKAPVNGRLMDVDDIVFSWNRYAEKGTDRRFLANNANPDAPVLSVTAPDARTIVFKLKEPVVFLLPALTPSQTGKPNIVPKETDGAFDIRVDMIGTGPFMMEKYQPTVGWTFKRNPDYFDKDYPLIDEIDLPIILEYSQALSQLKAGNIYTYSTGNYTVRAEDIVAFKRDVPQVNIYENESSGFSVNQLTFGWLPTDANKPFKDARVRKAVSLSIDRDAWIDAFNNVSGFEADGLPVKTAWNTNLAAGAGSWWLDPQGKDFGSESQWYAFNVAEAKKLLAAAGYPNGVSVSSIYIGGTQLGSDFQRRVGVMDTFTADAGFKVSPRVIDYTAEYVPILRDSNGKFEGWGYRAGGSPANDAVAYLSTLYHSKYGGPGFLGFDVSGKGDGSGDPDIDSTLNKARAETDTNKRLALVHDIQRMLAKNMYMVPAVPGQATGFYIAWPVIGNFQAFQGDRRTQAYHWWIDNTKAPLA
jgi:peptide/nickel transport system substrate-binding protein